MATITMPSRPDRPMESAPEVGLFAEVVFDRPLDQAYTYAVPEEWAGRAAVGKRVEAPFGRGDKSTVGYCVRLLGEPPPRAVKPIRRVIDDDVLLTEELLRLTRWMADYYLCGWGQVLHAVLPTGVRENAGLKEVVYLQPAADASVLRALPKLPAKQAAVWQALRRADGPVEQQALMRRAKCGPAPIRALIARGAVVRTVDVVDTFAAEPAEVSGPDFELNDAQQAAWERVRGAIDGDGYKPFLLHGVTGSGKTEVYLRAIEEVVRRGKEAIVLVPEISLTPQTIERFRGRCGNVAVLHSSLTDTERGAHWRRVASGEVQVVVGARSAVFAPTRKLGLIVIDEEHETSFKQEQTPRYHARDVAVMRARLENVPIVMGSATPSLESWHNAERGQYELLSLPERVSGRPMPPVSLVDMRHEPKPGRGRPSAIGPTLEDAMRQALKGGGQVMLMLNRRGFATYVHCPDCGKVVECRRCDLSMTYHKRRDAMVCHHCGYDEPPARRCAGCGKETVKYNGLGTEKLHAEIEAKFPDKVVQRMDSDTMNRPGSHARVLEAFRGGLIHILLGTQMIAKGLDFPNVTLVGVVNADVGLHLPDFRSAERTFQLLAQVAGRAGRGDKGGRVVVQTHTPEHPGVALAARHDYLKFAAWELAHRAKHGYPPYQRMARLIVRSEDEQSAGAFADTMAGAFREARRSADEGVRVLGPAEAPVFRLNGYYRFHFQLQSAHSGSLHRLLRGVLRSVRPPSGVEFQVDVDPAGML